MLYDTSIPDYNIHRLNLDAALLTNDAAFIGFLVDEYLRPYVLGQFALMMDVNGVSGSDANRQLIVDAANEAIIMYDFCALVSDCIETNETTRNAISKLLRDGGVGGSGNGANTVIGSDSLVYSQDNILTGNDCTSEGIAGECVAIVEALDVIAQDWLQKFAGFSFASEAALAIIESIPLVGHLTPNDTGLLLDWITDEVLTQYASAYDTALRNEAACLIYLECCQDCTLSIDNMLSAFAEKVSIGLNPSKNWSSLMADLRELSVNDQLVYGTWLLILATWKAGNLFLGLNGSAVLTYSAQTATPINPSVIGCQECGFVPCVEYDFKLSEGEWDKFETQAEYDLGVGWRSDSPVGRLAIISDLNTLVAGSYDYIQVRMSNPIGGDRGIYSFSVRDASGNFLSTISNEVQPNATVITSNPFTLSANQRVRVRLEKSANTSDPISEAIESIEVCRSA